MNGSQDSSHLDHERASQSVGALGCAILTLSDTRDEQSDRSGQYLHQAIGAAGHRVEFYRIVRDDPDEIAAGLEAALADPQVQLVISNGGTGISVRDSAYEVISGRLDKRLDGFGELFRMLSFEEIGAAAMLSRAVGGTVGRKIVFALPGSTKAVRLGFERLIAPQAAHLHQELHKDR